MTVELHVDGHEHFSENDGKALFSMIDRVVDASLLEDVSLSILFVSDEEMRDLNKQFRKKNQSTDVLSFSAQEGVAMPGLESVLGDIVISVERANEQAQEFGHSLLDEVAVLIVHGIAHLVGFDHEKGDDEAIQQAQWEMSILDAAEFPPELALLARAMS